MLTLRQLLNAIGQGDWFTAIVLTDAYLHVAIHLDHQQFLRFLQISGSAISSVTRPSHFHKMCQGSVSSPPEEGYSHSSLTE